MTTDNTQELDEILGRAIAAGVDINFEWDGVNEFNRKFGDALKEAKQALLDWHNKQVEAVLDRLESMAAYDPSGVSPVISPREIEAERNNSDGDVR